MGEIFTVVLPDIGEGVVEGEVLEWLKDIGDPLSQDEPVVVVMTDKASVELPAPYPGKLSKKYYDVGGIAIKDQPLYDIDVQEGVPITRKPSKKEPTQRTAEPRQVSDQQHNSSTAKGRSLGQVLATPPTRKLAEELGIDIGHVVGTGPAGVVTKKDVAAFGQGTTFEQKPIIDLPGDQREPLQGLRRVIAERMSESKKLIPHFSFHDTLNAKQLVKFREKSKLEAEKAGVRLTFMPFFIRALSLAIKQFPYVNSSLDLMSEEIVLHTQQNIGIAVKTKRGLIVPVLKGVESLDFHGIIRSYDQLIQKAKEQKLSHNDMQDATITISNFGAVGGKWANPVINYPEVAILGIAKIEEQPVVRNGEITIGKMLNLSWSFDHRVLDGDQAASFSNTFIDFLENPVKLL